MQTFSKSKEVNFENIALMVEANTVETTDTLFGIAQQLSNRCYKTDSEQRKKFIFRLYLPVILQITCTRLPKSY